MKSKFLIQKGKEGQKFSLKCFIPADLVVDISEKQCLGSLKDKIGKFLNSKGREWVDQSKGGSSNSGEVNCPEGYILLPLDAWCCKHDKKICRLQSSINLKDKENFLSKCRSQNKENIFTTIKNKKYDGFHHVPGRYLCPYCDHILKESQQNYKYHYPWELYRLREWIDFNDSSILKRMRMNEIPSSIRQPVCAICFLKLLDLLSLSDDNDKFFVLEMDFYPR